MNDTPNVREPALRRVLGLGPLLAVAIGLVVSQGVMVLMLQGAGTAGLGFIVPLGVAYLLALSYAFSFSELALMIPRAGSLSSYTEVAIGHFPAILATFSGYVVVAMFALSAELLLLDLIIGKVYPGALPPMLVAYGVLGLFTLLNLLGIDIFARLQSALALLMMIVLLVLGLGAVSSEHASVQTALASGWNPLGVSALALTAMAVWGFVGAEFVCPLVEETRRPERNIPRSMILGLSIIFLTIALYCFGALLCIPQAELAGDPLPHFLFANRVFGEYGQMFLVIAAITGLPILILGQDPDSINLLLLAAALAWLLAYIIAHVDVLALRRRYPHIARPFRTPFYPLPQLFGIAGMIYAVVHVSPTPEMTGRIFASAGVVLGVVSLVAVVWIKGVMRKPLFVPEPLETAGETAQGKSVALDPLQSPSA